MCGSEGWRDEEMHTQGSAGGLKPERAALRCSASSGDEAVP